MLTAHRRLSARSVPMLALAGAALLLGSGCKKEPPASQPAPPAAVAPAPAVPAGAPQPPAGNTPVDIGKAAELIVKYEKFATDGCACKDLTCFGPIKAGAQGQLALDAALSLSDADRTTLRAAVVRLYQCEPGANRDAAAKAAESEASGKAGPGGALAVAAVSAAPAGVAPTAVAPTAAAPTAVAPTPTPSDSGKYVAPEGEEAAAEGEEAAAEGEEAAAEGEEVAEGDGADPAGEGQGGEGSVPAAAPAAPAAGNLPTSMEPWFSKVAQLPYGDEFADFFTKQGVAAVAQVWGKSRDVIGGRYPDALRPDTQDVRPYFTSLVHETESTNDADKTVVLVAGFVDDQLFQLSLKLQKSESDMKDQLTEALGREWDREIDDGYQVKAYVWDLPGHIVKVREKGPYRTVVIADATRAAAFAERDTDAIAAEIANTKGLELMTRFPRSPNSRAALAKFNEALGLVEDFGHALVNACNVSWVAWGDFEAAREFCTAAQESGQSDVRAEATMHLGLIANASGNRTLGKSLLAQAAAMEVQDGFAPALAKKYLAMMKGTATRAQFLSLLDDAVCAAAENDEERGKRLLGSLGITEDELQALANALGISGEDLLSRDKGRCVSRSGQTW